MAGKRGCWFVVPMVLSVILTASASKAEEVILLDDTPSQPTATLTAVPAGKTVPSPTPTPVPAKTPVPAPTKVESPASSVETPLPDADLSDSARLARRLGILRHPVILFALDGNYAYATGSADPSIRSGFGLDARVEAQFFTWFSAGTYYDLVLFPASGRIVWTGPWGLMGRIIPFGMDKTGEFSPFLTGGAGINSLMALNAPQYPGNLHAFVGLGARYPFGDKWAAEFGLTYHFYGSPSPDMETISARAGLDYSFEP
ncbi:MAG TPA: hypothetical protein VJ873_07530 [bacterium]|nr:hypothetical protein [bacterium]